MREKAETSTETKGLDPCPFCGGIGELRETEGPLWGDNIAVCIKCRGCGCVSRLITTGQKLALKDIPAVNISLKRAKAEAIAAWNQRANVPNEDFIRESCVSSINEMLSGTTDISILQKIRKYAAKITAESNASA